MTRKILYFPISAADQNRIDPASIQVETGPPDFPDAMRIRFTITNPADGAPRIQPFFPGQMSFLPEPGGTLPDETTTFAFTPAEYQTWQTLGTLLVDANDASMRTMKTMTGTPAPPGLLPNRVAYWPIRLPESFLYGTLITGNQLKHSRISRETGGSYAIDTSDWKAQAVAGFLNTTYKPQWREHATDPTQDDVVRFAMPTVEMDPVSGAVEFWMAGAFRPGEDFLDDQQSTDLDVATIAVGAATPDDIHHPLNGAVAIWNLIQLLEHEMIDADLLNNLADKITIRFPETPRFLEFRFTLMGRQKENYHCGAFTVQRIIVRDGAGNVFQDRRIPLNGRITVAQLPPAAALPVVTVELGAGPLDPDIDFVGMVPAGPRTFSIDFSSVETPRLTLVPDSTLYGEIIVALHSAPTTQTITGQTLAAWENDIRPAGWPPAGLFVPSGSGETNRMIFSGSRRPWFQITAGEIDQFLAGLRRIVSGGPPPGPPIRPANAILLWIMEGKAAGTTKGFGFVTNPARPWVLFKSAVPGFSNSDLAAASDSDIKTCVRVWALWNLWGLDDFNHHAVGHDNEPLLSGNLSTAVANQDAAFEAGRARISATGVNPPALSEINDAFEVAKAGSSNWVFRITSDHHERLIWLQYSEMQRRLILLAPNLTPPSNDVWNYFGFGYMSYNGGMEDPSFNLDLNKTVFREWTDASGRIGVAPCTATNQQAALRCKKVTPAEMAMVAPTPPKVRRGSSRINGMQVAALSESFALVYPSVV